MNNKIFLLIPILAVIWLALTFDVDTYFMPPDVQLPDGGRYYGELGNGLFSGAGKIIYSNGASYHGQFKKGLYSGIGKMVTVTGVSYQGQFSEGKLTGQGKIETEDVSSYQGQIKNFKPHGFGRLDYESGSYYVGKFKEGKFHGQGTLVETEGDSYTGQFENNKYHGRGQLLYSSGGRYRGYFKKGELHGQGKLVTGDGNNYDGTFVHSQFTGKGVFEDTEGIHYQGLFKDWLYHGQGKYSNAAGDVYEGEFVEGVLTGPGSFKGKKGKVYKGQFKSWYFDGKGELLKANGDHYRGEFRYNLFNGPGVLTYAKPKRSKTELRGHWRHGRFVGDGKGPDPIEASAEKALYLQNDLIVETLAKVQTTESDRINLYFVGIAGDGKQNVFYDEVSSIQTLFDKSFATLGRSAILANNPETVSIIPLVTTTSIERVLQGISKKMDTQKDILFLYFTSHGSKKHDLAIDQNGLSLPNLSAQRLADIVHALPIKWKVIVISACYSGGFIPHLVNDHTLIITASAHDRSSFGCTDDAEMTYFGRAFFLDALLETDSFIAAFDKATELIIEREKEIINDQDENHSDPQISKPEAITEYLKQWRGQLGPITFEKQALVSSREE